MVVLGAALGVGLTVGAFFAIKEYAPTIAAWYLERQGGPSALLGTQDIEAMVADVLGSPECKSALLDMVKGQTDTLESVLRESMESAEFRKTLSDILGEFFSTQEGKDLLKRIIKENLVPQLAS